MTSLSRLVVSCVFLVWLGLSSAPARADLHALLVGVSSYPSLPERLRLEGPRNDVQRMRQVLLGRGLDDARLQMLADGLPGAAAPTRANILAAIDGLAGKARPGDVVFIHFAGHGSRQPAVRHAPGGRETPGGLEPSFLPIDVGAWDGGQFSVRNAITASELRTAIDRISDRGAFVWAVFDACHSAAIVRGEAELRYRHVDPTDLGMPAEVLERMSPARLRGLPAPVGALDGNPGKEGSRASAAYFYATQVDELTPELRLPTGDRSAKPYGLFSFVVSRALEKAQPMSYRQLAQYILAEYGGLVEARATPLFSGDGLDRLVLGQTGLRVRQWPLEPGPPLSVSVGNLSGIGKGAVLAVLPGPLAKDHEALGHVEVGDADANRSLLTPIAHARLPAPGIDRLRSGQSLRLVQAPPVYTLRASADLATCADECMLRQVARRLQAQGVAGVDLAWVDRADRPEVLLRQRGDRLLLLTGPEQSAQTGPGATFGVPLTEGGRPLAADAIAARLGRELHALARARNLLRLAAALATQANATGLVATLRAIRAGTSSPGTVSAEQVPRLKSGDRLQLSVENGGQVSQDLTVVYLDADHGIKLLFPNRLGESNRVEPGARQLIDDIVIGTPPVGIERLLLIAVPARPQGERADFSFLEQPALDRQRGGASADTDALADAAFAAYRTRGAARPMSPGAGMTMQAFTLHIVP